MADAGRRAVFLDRDGTIVEGPGFLHEPGKVRLLAGAGEAIHQLNQAGWLVITVSNQSGIARGLYGAAAYQAVQRRLVELLAAHDARLDGAYFCPHHPAFTGPCECRKPGLLLFREAQAALGLDLTRCCWVGGRLSDVEPARKLGGRALLVEAGGGATYVANARGLRSPVVAGREAARRRVGRPL